MTCGERIYECRLKEKISKERLAREVGISVQTLESWESGASLPEPGKLLVLAAVLHTDASYLEHGTQARSGNNPEGVRKISRVFYTMAMILYFIGIGTGEFDTMASIGSLGINLVYYGDSPTAIALLFGAALFLVLGVGFSVLSRKKRQHR